MTLSDDRSIEALALRVIDRSLPKAEWTHAGHFAAALWLLRNRPELTRPDEMRTLISRYNEATGTANIDTGGYHHTITLASIHAAAHARGFGSRPALGGSESPGESLAVFDQRHAAAPAGLLALQHHGITQFCRGRHRRLKVCDRSLAGRPDAQGRRKLDQTAPAADGAVMVRVA